MAFTEATWLFFVFKQVKTLVVSGNTDTAVVKRRDFIEFGMTSLRNTL